MGFLIELLMGWLAKWHGRERKKEQSDEMELACLACWKEEKNRYCCSQFNINSSCCCLMAYASQKKKKKLPFLSDGFPPRGSSYAMPLSLSLTSPFLTSTPPPSFLFLSLTLHTLFFWS